VLLSFAQFERELIAERTRDKMAAARRKGKWGGGLPVLGFDVDVSSKKLVINEEEAVRVRAIFALYLQHRGLLPVLAELARRGWATKQTRTGEGGVRGGRSFTRSSLYRLLTNVTYIGQVRYRNEIHLGEQPAIVDLKIWQEVQALLVHNGPRRTGTVRTPSQALLQGLLFCRPCGCAMTPAQVSRGNRRYRYYTCSAAQRKGWHTCPSKSLPAGAVERYVLEQIASRMPGGRAQVQAPATESPAEQRRRLRDCVARIDNDGTTGEMAITLNAHSSSLKESA
jgi:site-specific DNA recombinase